MLPLGAGAWEDRAYRADAAGSGGDEGLAVDINVVSPGWLSSVGLPLLSGRNFSAHDRGGVAGVAVVNEVFARSMWGRADALGRRFRLGQSEELLEVVGVTRSARYRSLLELPRPVVLRPFGQVYQAPMTLHVRTDGDPAALVPAIRRLGESLDRALPLHRVQSMAERLDVSVAAHRTGASLVAGPGAPPPPLPAPGPPSSVTVPLKT